MSDDDLTAFLAECHRDLEAVREELLRAHRERDHYHHALQHVADLLRQSTMRAAMDTALTCQ